MAVLLEAGDWYETYIRVRLIDEGIKQFHGLPDAHVTTALEVDASLDVERNRFGSL